VKKCSYHIYTFFTLVILICCLHCKGDLFPDEGIWLWKVDLPLLSALRSLATGTVLGPEVEKQVNWYLHPEHVAILLVRLMPQLNRLAHIIDNFATSVCTGSVFLFLVNLKQNSLQQIVTLDHIYLVGFDGNTRYASNFHYSCCL
jgi:hypothetical protein